MNRLLTILWLFCYHAGAAYKPNRGSPLPANCYTHNMSGRSAEAILLGVLREGQVSQMSHAGYLGGELAKAETAIRLGLKYEQGQPLR